MGPTKGKLTRELMAMRISQELFDGAVVNLGIGIPTLVSSYIPEGMTIIFHTQNGALGFGPVVTADEVAEKADVDLINAGGQYITPLPGMCFFHHADSFGMIRGGHIDLTVLGALQVSEKGDLANWLFPARGVGNIGGGMDLAVGAKKVIAAMEHVTKNGELRILKECNYPLTAKECVDLIVTDIAVIEVTREGLVLREHAPGWTAEEVQALTEPRLIIPPDLKEISF
ncbi:MAG TPA: 3-oxoacid CoA-transferase subunit B [Dehalococcoidia bacterium]|nr:3-oxoacid CoA-transferase subunit B [Dehalococcoidia bacterium]